MSDETDRMAEIGIRVLGLAEEVDDLVIDHLRVGITRGTSDENRRAGETIERRLTKARRSLEKAAHLLGGNIDE